MGAHLGARRPWLRLAAMVPAALALAGIPLFLATRPAAPVAAQTASETVVLTATNGVIVDTYISEGAPETAQDGVLLNLTGDGAIGARQWPAIRFDVSTVPAGVAITSATLQLSVENPASGPMTVTPIRLGAGATWTEQATWAVVNAAWNSGTIGASQAIDTESTSVTFDVTTDVALFANGTPNHGWVLRALTGGHSTGFASSEAAAVEKRPVLTVTYAVPASTLRPGQATYANDIAGTYEDTTITSDDLTGNRSGLDSLTVGKTAGANSEALVRFALGADIPGAQILDATLTLTTLSEGQPRTLGVSRICQPVSLLAAGAVSNASYGGIPYGALAPVGTQQAVFSGQAAMQVDVTAIVQSWANGEPNLGIAIQQLTGPLADTVRFHSFNAGTPSLRPQLEIRYLPGAGSPAAPSCGQAVTSTPTATMTATSTPSATTTTIAPTATPTASPTTSATATTTATGPLATQQLVVVAPAGATGRSRLVFTATDGTGTGTNGRFIIRGKVSNQYFNAVTGTWHTEPVQNGATKTAAGPWELPLTGPARRGIANLVVIVEFRATLGTAESVSAAAVEITVR